MWHPVPGSVWAEGLWEIKAAADALNLLNSTVKNLTCAQVEEEEEEDEVDHFLHAEKKEEEDLTLFLAVDRWDNTSTFICVTVFFALFVFGVGWFGYLLFT